MYELQVGGYKEDMATMANEMCELKKIYYTQKRKFQKIKETTLKSTYKTIFPDILTSNKKFYGGGFKIATPIPKICCILNTSNEIK